MPFFNKTVTKLVTILTKCFFPYLNPTSYLNDTEQNDTGGDVFRIQSNIYNGALTAWVLNTPLNIFVDMYLKFLKY